MSDLDAIRERHRPVPFVATAWCIEDVQAWPCDAVRLLGIIEAADQLADQVERNALLARAAPWWSKIRVAVERYRKERG